MQKGREIMKASQKLIQLNIFLKKIHIKWINMLKILNKSLITSLKSQILFNVKDYIFHKLKMMKCDFSAASLSLKWISAILRSVLIILGLIP